MLRVSDIDFMKSPDVYLEMVESEAVTITKDGRIIAVLAKPSDSSNVKDELRKAATPISDSLLGILEGSGVRNRDDIKNMRLGEYL